MFSREPVHNWASHPSDAFAYGCQVMSEILQKNEEKEAKFAVNGHNNGFTIQPLNNLCAEAPRRSNRI